MKIEILKDEYWYGLSTVLGSKMPLDSKSNITLDLTVNKTPNQAVPFLVSTKGRYIWSEQGFKITVKDGVLTVPDSVIFENNHLNLKNAYLHAMKNYFPFSKHIPAKKLFSEIIYNSWIELTFFQNQVDIINYAKNIISNDLPKGVLMIDDGWSNYYGDWTFHKGNFPSPKEMIRQLNDLGFEVMLWICPFISADSVAYREAVSKDILIKTPEGTSYITEWWNGHSAVLDLSNPDAVDWLRAQLNELEKIGIVGFKFDAGDSVYYKDDNITFGNLTPNEQSQAWAKFGEAYSYNEYRVTFKAGGYGLLQRLCDKQHSWNEEGIASLIPDSLLQGITGHPYGSPDMIGGGEYKNFQEHVDNLDQELFVRHAEIASLLPAMQFSAAPYRILNEDNFKAVKLGIANREKYTDYITNLVEQVPITGEPIIRYMSYEFPNEPVGNVVDQYMLGNKYLVAPIYKKGKSSRTVYLPKGEWFYCGKMMHSEGETIEIHTRYGVPAIFENNK